MKPNLTKMIKKYLFFLLVIVLAIPGPACNKEMVSLPQRREVPGLLKERAINWYNEQTKNYALDKSMVFGELRPLWDEAWSVPVSGASELMIVPCPEINIMNPEIKMKRIFMFSLKNKQVKEGKVIEFTGKNYDVHANIDWLISNLESSLIAGLNGNIKQYDVNYSYLRSAIYSEGVKVPGKAEIRSMRAGSIPKGE